MAEDGRPATRLQRFLLPGFAFKAVVIGGGYATGRELVEFFMPCGPWGGVLAILLAMVLWSLVCAITFALARRFGTYDYKSFFRLLLGPAWIAFEVAYLILVVLILAVYGAAAGALGYAVLGMPKAVGTMLLVAAIAGTAAFGNRAIEQLFRYVSFLLYAVYAVFAVLAFGHFSPAIDKALAASPPPHGWVFGGLAYSGYNVIGAVAVLATLRHATRERDAVVAGLIAGPLAMMPALLFFVAMTAFYPEIERATLPSDFMLRALQFPAFHVLFQTMIFFALLESGAATIHSINERIAGAWQDHAGHDLTPTARFLIAITLLIICVFLATGVGLVRLISDGYGTLTYFFLAIYVLPVLTVGTWRLLRRKTSLTNQTPRTIFDSERAADA